RHVHTYPHTICHQPDSYCHVSLFLFLLILRPLVSTLFPYTTLFRSFENRTLQRKMIEKQLVVSEYPIGAKPLKFHFPERNRKIADRKSTRLNSSHVSISYAVFCLKKKKKTNLIHHDKKTRINATQLS